MKVQTNKTINDIKTLPEKKLTVSVWDDRIRDICYQNHFQNLRNIKRKIDNNSPFVASSYILRKEKFQNEQRSKQILALANNAIINRLNVIFRTKGKIDHYNIYAYKKASKLRDKITECRNQSKANKENKRVLMNTKTKLVMSTLEMDHYWENKQRLILYQKSVYPIVLNSVMCAKYDVEITNPPNQKEYEENPKVVLEFQMEDQPLGKVVILLVLKNAPLVCGRFLKLCSSPQISYENCMVHKIISGIYMEAGYVGKENSECFDSCTKFEPDSSIMTHNHKGSVSMIMDSNRTVNSRFNISFKPLQILNENRVVFGQVIKGFDVLNLIDSQGTIFGVPRKTVFISKSRVFL